MKPPLPTLTKERAKELRTQSTDAENKLWFHLRSSRLVGFKFRRQHPIPPYVVDFYCEAAKLAVEVDDSQHTAESDAERTEAIERGGVKLLRFWDNEVLENTQEVLEVILKTAHVRALTPTLSRREREQGKAVSRRGRVKEVAE